MDTEIINQPQSPSNMHSFIKSCNLSRWIPTVPLIKCISYLMQMHSYTHSQLFFALSHGCHTIQDLLLK